jgi:hypothetical protein
MQFREERQLVSSTRRIYGNGVASLLWLWLWCSDEKASSMDHSGITGHCPGIEWAGSGKGHDSTPAIEAGQEASVSLIPRNGNGRDGFSRVDGTSLKGRREVLPNRSVGHIDHCAQEKGGRFPILITEPIAY